MLARPVYDFGTASVPGLVDARVHLSPDGAARNQFAALGDLHAFTKVGFQVLEERIGLSLLRDPRIPWFSVGRTD